MATRPRSGRQAASQQGTRLAVAALVVALLLLTLPFLMGSID
jgi:hypothetical protein